MRKILISFLLTITAAFAFSSTQPDNINAPLTESQINDRIERAKAEAQRQIDAGIIQGAVFAATNIPPTPVGYQRIHPKKIPMTANSRFDIASVTKNIHGRRLRHFNMRRQNLTGRSIYKIPSQILPWQRLRHYCARLGNACRRIRQLKTILLARYGGILSRTLQFAPCPPPALGF